jgi:hypothetical protein
VTQTPAGPSAATALRPPGDGECQFCGSTPAAHVAFQSVTSAVILFWVGLVQGWMCRACGLAVFRRQNSRSLVGAWWGVGIFALPIFLIANRVRLGRILRLEPPRPTAGVAGQVSAPLDPGRSVLRRRSGIFALVMAVVVIPLLVLLVLFLIGSSSSG